VAGVTWALAFPHPGWAGLAWIAPGLLLAARFGELAKRPLLVGYLAGLVHALISLHWLLWIPFPLGAVAGWVALSAYMALYPAAWVWLCWRVLETAGGNRRARAFGADETGAQSPNGWWQCLERLSVLPLPQRLWWPLFCAAAWVALEMVRSRLFTGFPWNLLGVSQYQMLPLVQVAAVAGVYGLSFLIVWTSVALAVAASQFCRRPVSGWALRAPLLPPLLALVIAMYAGMRRTLSHRETATSIEVALIQPSIPQTLLWDPAETPRRFESLLRLSRLSLGKTSELLVWPEAALPVVTDSMQEAVFALAREHKLWIVLGTDDATPRSGARTDGAMDYYNAAVLIGPDGRPRATYRKRRLVIFGEYVPLGKSLPFLQRLAPIGEGFVAGDRAVPFHLDDREIETSVLICFEDVFPHLARADVRPGTDFLLNLTNNGWFGETAAQWQHAANAAFRAVENGIPLVRCANNGLTCWVDAIGRWHAVAAPGFDNIYAAGFKVVRIPLERPKGERTPTVYHRYGDWFGWLCVGVTGLAGGITARPRRKAEAE
jgi:apolipoprotein N-acyltransferase